MSTVRRPAVAGLFYPDDCGQLTEMVRDLLGGAQTALTAPKALIAPHAGYVYSGPVAANAYARVWAARDIIKRVVLLGPSHRYAFRGVAASSAAAFASPLGAVPVDREAMLRIGDLPQVQVLDEAHRMEHCLEVHLPFLQTALDNFTVVPLVVGETPPQAVSEVIESLWGGEETLIVISSDLSHYHDYETAIRLDGATSRAIEALRPEEIDEQRACGHHPLNGLLHAARTKGLRAQTIDLRNSADTAGPRHRVVGYGAYALE